MSNICLCLFSIYADVVVGFRGTPQLIQGEVNVTVAITSGQLQEGVELGVVVDNSYLLPNGE